LVLTVASFTGCACHSLKEAFTPQRKLLLESHDIPAPFTIHKNGEGYDMTWDIHPRKNKRESRISIAEFYVGYLDLGSEIRALFIQDGIWFPELKGPFALAE